MASFCTLISALFNQKVVCVHVISLGRESSGFFLTHIAALKMSWTGWATLSCVSETNYWKLWFGYEWAAAFICDPQSERAWKSWPCGWQTRAVIIRPIRLSGLSAFTSACVLLLPARVSLHTSTCLLVRCSGKHYSRGRINCHLANSGKHRTTRFLAHFRVNISLT